MTVFRYSVLPLVGLFLLLTMIAPGPSFADEKAGLAGWEKDSEYNKLYDLEEADEFKGTVSEIKEISPLKGMSPGMGLVVRDQDGDDVNVHLGPKSFVKVDSIGLKKGDKVKVKGCWADIEDEEIFMASKIKKDEQTELKVRRTKDGAPYWALSPEELTKEKEGQ
jgi:hypothetical protein